MVGALKVGIHVRRFNNHVIMARIIITLIVFVTLIVPSWNLNGSEGVNISVTHAEKGAVKVSRLLLNGAIMALRIETKLEITFYGKSPDNSAFDLLWVDSNADSTIDWIVIMENSIPIKVYRITATGFVLDQSERAKDYIQNARETIEAFRPHTQRREDF